MHRARAELRSWRAATGKTGSRHLRELLAERLAARVLDPAGPRPQLRNAGPASRLQWSGRTPPTRSALVMGKDGRQTGGEQCGGDR